MINSKVLPILRSFRKKELKKFHLFLQSQYFKKNKKVIELYEILIKYHPTFRNEELTNEKLYSALYNNNSYNNSTLINLFFNLMTCLEKYLVINNVIGKNNDFKFYLIEELTSRGFNNFTNTILNKLYSKLKKEKADSSYYYDIFRFNTWKYNYLASNNPITISKQLKLEIEALRNMATNLIKYFILNITNAYLNGHYYDDSEITKETKAMLNELILFFEIKKLIEIISRKNKGDFILEIYSALVNVFLNKDDIKNYYKYKDLVEKYANKLSSDEIAFHYSTLIGYMVLKTNQNNNKFGDELIELYNVILQNKYYIDRKTAYLLPERYREILIAALVMNKNKWANYFIEKYTRCLPANDIENMYNLAKGYYYFSMKDNRKTLDYLGKIKYEHFIFMYDVYNIKLQIFYDEGNHESALDIIDTYKKKLKSDTIISKERKRLFKNFIYYLEKAILYLNKKARVDIDYLNNRLSSATEVASKQWLLDRYDSILIRKISRLGNL